MQPLAPPDLGAVVSSEQLPLLLGAEGLADQSTVVVSTAVRIKILEDQGYEKERTVFGLLSIKDDEPPKKFSQSITLKISAILP